MKRDDEGAHVLLGLRILYSLCSIIAQVKRDDEGAHVFKFNVLITTWEVVMVDRDKADGYLETPNPTPYAPRPTPYSLHPRKGHSGSRPGWRSTLILKA